MRLGLAAETLAVLEMEPVTLGAVTVMVKATLAPLASEAWAQVTVVVPVQPGAETNVTPAGRVSTTLRVVAVAGPLLVTVSVYVRVWPTRASVGLAVLVIARSAVGVGTKTYAEPWQESSHPAPITAVPPSIAT
jgi:hypothetical protein